MSGSTTPGLFSCVSCRQAISQLPGHPFLDMATLIHCRRNIPLETRLELATCRPVGIAQMIVEFGVVGPQQHGALQGLHGLIDAAELVEGPAQRIDDIAILGLSLD